MSSIGVSEKGEEKEMNKRSKTSCTRENRVTIGKNHQAQMASLVARSPKKAEG